MIINVPNGEEIQKEVNQLSESLTAFNVDTQTYTDTKFRLATNNDEEIGMLDPEGNFMSFGGGNNGAIMEPIVVNQYLSSSPFTYIPKVTGNIVVSINSKNTTNNGAWGGITFNGESKPYVYFDSQGSGPSSSGLNFSSILFNVDVEKDVPLIIALDGWRTSLLNIFAIY